MPTLVSIIIPTFNSEKYLEETLQSILDQTYTDIEIVVIDGGSVDNTINIIKKYDDKISYWKSEKERPTVTPLPITKEHLTTCGA